MLRDYDHRTVEAPYLYCAEHDRHDDADLWHLRTLQPNVERMPIAATHSLEHALIYRLRAADERIVLAAPMGCGTGYYIVAVGLHDFDTMADLVADALTWATKADEVPWADDIHCGMADEHDADGMRTLAQYLLDMRQDWGSTGPNAQLITAEVG